jgi:NAD(P)-dependent dehydrogenase (short-subunit alcohol dehydrogenase family)
MKILIIDGMGGGIGKAVVERLRAEGHTLLAVGTNAIAAAAMHKAGADQAATGENAVLYNCKKADVIIGTLGVLLANSMQGEISPAMAAAVSASEAAKILLPVSKCNAYIVGAQEQPMAKYIEEIPGLLKKLAAEGSGGGHV